MNFPTSYRDMYKATFASTIPSVVMRMVFSRPARRSDEHVYRAGVMKFGMERVKTFRDGSYEVKTV